MVDIVIRCHNNRELIEKAVDSVREHTKDPHLILVDMGSKDGSVEYIKSLKGNVTKILNNMNLGCAIGRNQGIKHSTSKHIVFIDSDVIIRDSEWIEKLQSRITPDCQYIEGLVKIWDGSIMFAGGACHLVTKNLFNRIGWWDDRFFFGTDNEFYCRMIWLGWNVGFCEETNIYHKCGGTITDVLGLEYRRKKYDEAHKMLAMKYSGDLLHKFHLFNQNRRKESDKWIGKKPS